MLNHIRAMEGRGHSQCRPGESARPVVADSHHFEEDLDPDQERNPHYSKKLDPDPHRSVKLDSNPD
jgi:hypothetical protein